MPGALAVIGAGWAGLAAAVEAVTEGWSVTLFETAEQAGGRAREVRSADFHDFELILAADRGHVRQLERRRPRGAGAAVELMLPWCGIDSPDEVPDPYYGPLEGFEAVYELLDRAARRLVVRLQGGS